MTIGEPVFDASDWALFCRERGPTWWRSGAPRIYGWVWVALIKQGNTAARIDPGVALALEVHAREGYAHNRDGYAHARP